MRINFTMLVRDRYDLTRQALESLNKAGLTNMHVTIVDDRSKPETAELLEGFSSVVSNVCVLRNKHPWGTGVLRNMAVQAASMTGRGDYLYLSDNDVYFKQGWLQTLINCYEKAESKGWGFKVIGAYNHPFHQPINSGYVGYMGTPTKDRAWMNCDFRVDEVNALASQSMLMRWETWDTFGPFCETPVDKVCQSEDVDFTNKIRAAGFKIGVVSPPLIVNTGITNSFGEHIPGWEMVKRQCPLGVICE